MSAPGWASTWLIQLTGNCPRSSTMCRGGIMRTISRHSIKSMQAPHWVCACAIKGPINYSASVRTPITGDVDGYQVNLRSTWRAPLSDKLSLSVGPGLTYSSKQCTKWRPSTKDGKHVGVRAGPLFFYAPSSEACDFSRSSTSLELS